MIQPLPAPQGYRIKESYRVRYEEIDAQGIVNHAQYANYLTGARVAYFRAIGLETGGMTRAEIQPVVAHLEVDFLAPARFDDHLDVWCRVTRIGKTSLEFEYQVQNGMTGEPQAKGKTVLVSIALETLAPVQVPEDLRRRIEKFEQW